MDVLTELPPDHSFRRGTALLQGIAMVLPAGALMLAHAKEIDWDDPLKAIPAFLTLVTIPLTFSIANGLAFGFLSSTVLNVLAGRARRLHWLVYVLAALCALRFFYLGHG
jgi:AGZA family xanthine/uracil permease-like MFS transporter